ncbi:hypothetical protein HPC49_13850 [Pyxidicoccus fallax]|uniref:Uncharacterized protein n=1 Tax=Pyxidicoccus fallax TaxID=394095 RepID=A0A848LGQ2_9BACT|nr:hypothetical protein [Pyxidicoccus fallax]NMO15921.1 hypothetical protein [Pyxidicoccus fallax]NPC79317.1 hypothetical protein [Pyxidicoccus fallax]
MSPSTHRVQLLRAPEAGPRAGAATLALARALGIPRADAALLLSAVPRVLPRGLPLDAAQRLLETLRAAGAEGTVLEAPASGSRCAEHPALEDEGPCEVCGARICAVCVLARGARRCGTCERRLTRARRFQHWRVAVLLVGLCVALVWGFSVQRQRDERTTWTRPLRVAVVLLGEDDGAAQVLRNGLPRLESWFAREHLRHRPDGLKEPVRFEVFGPVHPEAPLPWPDDASSGWLGRLRYMRTLQGALEPLDTAVRLEPRGYDARLYVVVESDTSSTFAEGVGAAGGELGLVQARVKGEDATLALTALAHELLHCLGATDKYDAQGHALLPQGLVDPERSPLLPQQQAEVMVGEVPLEAGTGKLPDSLDELAVGPLTAAEVRWTSR